MESSIPNTTLIDTLQWRRKTTFPHLALSLPQSPYTDESLEPSGARTPVTPITEPFSMPLIAVSPMPEIPESVTIAAEIHAQEEDKLNTPIITTLSTPPSPFVDTDDSTETLTDKAKTELIDADSATEDIPASPHFHISNSAVVIKTDQEPILVSSSEGEENLGFTTKNESADLQKQLLILHRKEQSYLRQLVFWADTVAKLGKAHDRPPTKPEFAARKKLLASGD